MEAQRLPKENVLQLIENLQEHVWDKIGATIKEALKRLVEGLLEDELTNKLGAEKYQRIKERKGYRGGHYTRKLGTRYGVVQELKVPRPAGDGIQFTVFKKYQRRRWDVDAAIGRLFLSGVSTRKLKGIAQELFGQEVSATTVSKTTAYLDEELERYQTRAIADDFPFLFLDGISQKVREIGVEAKVMLCALGMRADGTKELLSFRLVDGEDSATWRAFLADLKARGLLGKGLKLITADGNPALVKAAGEIYPFLRVQRCIAHKLRNVVVKLKRANRRPCMGEAKAIFAAQSRKQALCRFKAWRDKWVVEEERAVRCLEKDLHHCLHYYSFPKELWKKIRTTNTLERAFRETRRRTRPMGVFPNEGSANRIMYGVTKMMNWNGPHPLRPISADVLT